MFIDVVRDFACVHGQSVAVSLSCGTTLVFSGVEVCKFGGPAPFGRDVKRIAALVASIPAEGGFPVVCVELRRVRGRQLLNAEGRLFASSEERDRALAARVDPLACWSGYEESQGPARSSGRAHPVLEPDLFGATG